ncbi:MAG: TraB/GumN family protein, partial [Phycisphaerae bacterium]
MSNRSIPAIPVLCIVGFTISGLIPPTTRADVPKSSTKKLTRIAHPFLWTIERNDKPSYLFGTIHIPREEVTDLPASVRSAFEKADVVQVEIPLDAATQLRVQGEMFRSDGKSLEEAVGKDLYRRADKIMQKRGLSIETFSGFKTSGAAAMLGMIDFMKDMATNVPLDMKLFQDAIAAEKEVGGIETAEEQIEILFNMEEKKAVHLFRAAVEDIEKADAEGQPQGEKLLQLYLAGDLDDLMKMMFETY